MCLFIDDDKIGLCLFNKIVSGRFAAFIDNDKVRLCLFKIDMTSEIRIS